MSGPHKSPGLRCDKHQYIGVSYCNLCEVERLRKCVSNLRGLVRAVASETNLSMEEVEQSINYAEVGRR